MQNHDDVVGGVPAARFWRYITFEPNSGCWLWTARLTTGYGSVAGVGGRSVLTHRLSYEMHRGAIPVGLQIDHLCRTRACCNPDHLELVTQAENIRRGFISRGALSSPERRCKSSRDRQRERYRSDPEYAAKKRQLSREFRRVHPEYAVRYSEQRRERARTPECKAKERERNRERRLDPKYREWMNEYQRRYRARKKADEEQ